MKKFVTLFAAALVCVTSALFAACDPGTKDDGPVELDILNFWAGNEDEETYLVKTNTDGSLEISYEKSGAWQYVRRTFAYETADDLAKVNTLVIDGKMVTDTNDPLVTLKIEYNGDIAAKEVTFTMSETTRTYEWDLSEAKLESASRILLFAEGNRTSANGTITFTKLTLTSDAINRTNDVEANKEGDNPAQTVNTVTATSKTFNGGWYDLGDGVYTIEKSGTNYNVSYAKKSYSYAMLKAIVTGQALADMNSVRITVRGTAGERLGVKPFDKVEKIFTLTGGDDELIVDISTVTDVDYTAELPVLLFIQPGDTDVSGSFTIVNAEFSTEMAPVDAPSYTVNHITATETAVGGWVDGGDGKYTVTENNGVYEVVKAAEGSWSTLKAYVTGETLADMNTLKVVVRGTAGDSIIVKPFDKVEKSVTLTGGDDEIVVDLSEVSGVNYTDELAIFIFFNWDATQETSFTIVSAQFSTQSGVEEPPHDTPVVNTITNSTRSVGNWYDGGDGKYTVTENNGVYEVTKSANGSWAQLKADVTGAALYDMNKFKITLSGIDGDYIIISVFGKEYKLEPATSDEVTAIVDLSDVADKDFSQTQSLMIFFNWDAAEETGFTIVNAEFYPEINVVTAENNAVGGWVDGGDGKYTVTENDGVYEVTKSANGSWAQLKAYVTGEDLADMDTFTMTLTGSNGDYIIVNVFGKEYKLEPATSDEVVITVDISEVSGVSYSDVLNIMIFFNWDATEETSFTIVSAEFSAQTANS